MKKDRSLLNLPKEYTEVKPIDLKKDKETKLAKGITSVVTAIALFIIGYLIVPFSLIHYGEFFLFRVSRYLVCFVIFLIFALIIVHELIHGFFFKLYSGEKVNYGFTGKRAYAGCKAYFEKNPFLIITLSPVILLSTLLLFASIFLPIEWFWRIHILQIVNFWIANGDFHTAIFLRKLPSDTLIQDTGYSITFYSKIKK